MTTTTIGVDLRTTPAAPIVPLARHELRVTVDLADLALWADVMRDDPSTPWPDGFVGAFDRLATIADEARADRGLIDRRHLRVVTP